MPTGPIPVNLAAIEAKAGKREAKEAVARQITSEDRFEESVARGFNPEATERDQARYNRFKTLGERKRVKEAEEPEKIEEVSQKAEEELANQYGKRNRELPPDKLLALKAAIKEGMEAEEILKEVEKAFEDATLADEALEYLERAVEERHRDAVLRARRLHNIRKEREIKAGRNVDPAAKYFNSKGVGTSPTELRDLYRDITGNRRSHNQLFDELAKKYSFEELKLVVAFLLKGIGYDLKSKGPSIESAELLVRMKDLRNLQSILWVYLFFKSRMKLVKKLHKRGGLILNDAVGFELLAKEFIKLVEERYPSVLKLLKQIDKMGLMYDSSKVIVLMQYRDAIRQLSERLYRSLKHRQDLLLVILEAMEELEEEEEEEE